MPLVTLSPAPILRFTDDAGNALVGGSLWTYQAGTNTPLATYVDSTGTFQNSNPITLNSRGEVSVLQTGQSCGLWIPPNTAYKFSLFDALNNLIWTIDNVLDIQALLTQASIGAVLYPQTPSEAAVGVVPTYLYYPPGNVMRYGAMADGITDDTLAIQRGIYVSERLGGTLYFPSGVYLTTGSLTCISSMVFQSESIAGPRIYANPVAAYGGAEIVFTKTVSNRFDPESYALKIDAGTVNAEGFARVRVQGMGFSWTSPAAGGIYIEGAVDVGVTDGWFTGGLTNYDAGTLTGFCIYARDAIVSKFERNTFRLAAFGIVGESIFNENVITRNNFDRVSDVSVLLRGMVAVSIRGSIRDNNLFGDPAGGGKYGVYISGNTRDIEIAANTFEILTTGPIVASTVDYLDSANNGTPADLHIHDNTFIATNGSLANSAAISLTCNGATIIGNSLKSPTGPLSALINISSSSSAIAVLGNDPDVKQLITGDITKCMSLDAILFRAFPRDSSETTKALWTTDNGGSMWWNETYSAMRMWMGSLIATVKTDASGTAPNGSTTPSVKGISILHFANLAPVTVTNLLDGYVGQEVFMVNDSSHNVTIQNGLFALDSNTNVTLGQDEALTVKNINGGWWVNDRTT